MRWGSDDIGVVLTRNEIWLLLHALAGAAIPAVDWEGNRVEPWVVGELRARLQDALQPDPLSDIEQRPVIRLDSEMGQSLAQAGVRPLVLSDGYDLGSLFATCAERGWGATLTLPLGSGRETPAEARVVRGPESGVRSGDERDEGKGQRAKGKGDEDDDPRTTDLGPRTFVGLERPVVAMARAVIGAHEGTGHWALGTGDDEGNGKWEIGNSDDGDGWDDRPAAHDLRSRTDDGLRTTGSGPRSFEEYVIPSGALNPGEREKTVLRMAGRGWDLVGDDGTRLVFRRGGS